MFITPKRFITANNFNFTRVVILSIGILISGAIFSRLTGLFPLFLYFGDFYQNIGGISNIILNNLPFFFILNYFVYYIIIESICRFVYKRRENSLKLLLCFSLILFPMVLYLVLHFTFLLIDILNLEVIGILDYIILIILQVWSLWIQTYCLSVYKYLKIENSLILSLLVHYGAFSILLLISI